MFGSQEMVIGRTGEEAIPRRGGYRARAVAGVLVVASGLLLTGCSAGAGSKADFIDVLTRDGGFSDAQADCLAEAVFDEYEGDEDALGRISGATSYEFLLGEDGVDGFDEFLVAQVSNCTSFDLQPADS